MEEKRFISILSDYGFKVTFGNPQNHVFLKKALQALIASETPIRSVKLTKNEVTGITKEARGGLLDMVGEDGKGRVFVVEM